MELKKLLLELKSLLEEERELLLSFPLKDVDRFEKVQEEKKELLLKISSFEKEKVEMERELLLEIQKLNASITALITNGLSFFEEIEKELFGQSPTYRNKKNNSLFNKKI